MPANSSLYGKGVFTTVAVSDGTTVNWRKHWKRLTANAVAIGADISDYSGEQVADAVRSEIEQHRIVNGRARIMFLDERPSELWPSMSSAQKVSLHIMVGALRTIPAHITLTTSPFTVNSRSPLAGIKSCNYLEQIMAKDEGKGRGFDEAVRVNERGHVTSGCMANLFWLKGDRLFTPALSTGCLAGTTREYVLENIECEEVEADIGDPESADAIYLTSAGLGIVRVAEFNGRELADHQHAIKALWPPRE